MKFLENLRKQGHIKSITRVYLDSLFCKSSEYGVETGLVGGVWGIRPEEVEKILPAMRRPSAEEFRRAEQLYQELIIAQENMATASAKVRNYGEEMEFANPAFLQPISVYKQRVNFSRELITSLKQELGEIADSLIS